ncbi:Formyl-CoA:oxalate CoA-transferase [Geodia barretti]|uniref:Formyl-CoA:oxalate CoA-transferase n=1 Tax=Geodia barretti TaxID=519541 RepID=A0AA35XCM1_GEOBA|nr:Formyl-CoA:oxalate CoA-transferase [Geodia barretti]
MAGLNHPLENVRVIDLGRHQAGPRCALVLARMGAEVIKVRTPGRRETAKPRPLGQKQSSYWAIAHFTDHDVVAAPVNTIPQAAEDPHPWERRAMVEVPDFLAGEIAVSGDYWHFSRTPVNIGSTPQVGEHNEEVLQGILGYSEEKVEEFRQGRVISEEHYYDDIPG